MLHCRILPLAALAVGVVSCCAAEIVFHVSPDGDDAWSGRRAAGRAGDGPFRTLHRAQNAVRAARREHPSDAVAVEIHDGTYYLERTLVFGPEDGGVDGAPVTYRGWDDARPVICGGRVLTGWREERLGNGRRVWRVDLPRVKAGEWGFCQLFVQSDDAQYLVRRYRPTRGMFAIAGLTYAPAKKTMRHRAAQDEFRFFEGDIRQWENLEDVEILALHCWSASRLRIRELDLKKNVVSFTGYPTFRIGHWWKNGRNPYYVENVKEELDAPGEWYLDKPTGVLSYLPAAGETLENTRLIAPELEQIVSVAANADGPPVRYLHFKGLSFAVSQWTLPQTGYGGSQAMPDLRAAIEFTDAEDCSLEQCTIAHTGAYALSFGTGCQRNRVAGSLMYDLGGGGIKIGDIRMKQDAEPPVLPVGNVVENNVITQGGVMHFSANAVWAGIVKDTVIRHNAISDFPYSGIAVGWNWSFRETSCGGNRIEYNHIHNVVDLLGDGASIYTLGNQPGTVIRGNVLHDNVMSRFAPAPWQLAIYLDQGSAHILTENNLVYRVGTHAFNMNSGKHNTTRNNIFGPTFNPDLPFIRCYLGRPGAVGNTLSNNIIYWEGDVLVNAAWPTENCACDKNVYWNFAGKDVTFAGKTFAEWQATGQDPNSVIADPQFVGPENDDFRLLDKSPAMALGFQPFDAGDAGVQPQVGFATLPARFIRGNRPPVYSMPVPPEREIPFGLESGFEDVPLGRIPMETRANGTTEEARIQVTDDVACSGNRSLEFIDKAGLSRNFYPYLTYSRKKENGEVTVAFAYRNSDTEPISLTVNVRDYETARKLGKEFVSAFAVTFADTGDVMADDTKLGTVPLGEWAQVSIRFAVGEERSDTYTVQMTLPDGSKTQHDLPITDPGFRLFTWVGFIADGEKDGRCYLDDLKIGP